MPAADPDPWPLRHLVLRTPRLELRPDDDEGLRELIAVANRGIHPPETMPFAYPWTDRPPEELGPAALRFFWSQRAELRPDNWTVHFLVRREGRVIGVQDVHATDFAVIAQVSTGSWLGMAHQRQGYGTEMRAGVLQFAFDHLGARAARSAAFLDNAASLRVSRKLGYRDDGTETSARRGEPASQSRLLLVANDFVRPEWTITVAGLDGCRSMLGAPPR